MIFSVIILLAVCIVMPAYFAWRIMRLNEATKAGWLILVADALVFSVLVFLVGRWDIAGYYTRYILIAMLVGSVLWSLRRHISRPWSSDGFRGLWRSHWSSAFSLVPFSAALVYVVYGLLPPSNSKDLTFPLTGGRFVVGQGGGISLLNHHASHPEQRYAADISAIHQSGFRAHGVLPNELSAYAVYGSTVVSPCRGAVIATGDDLPDLIPPRADPENAIGNHVIIDCGGFDVELAHLMRGSVVVKTGDQVAEGDTLGKVGNSGNTTEPHLHIHAVDPQTGRGLPMSFDGSAPVRNRIYRYGSQPPLSASK